LFGERLYQPDCSSQADVAPSQHRADRECGRSRGQAPVERCNRRPRSGRGRNMQRIGRVRSQLERSAIAKLPWNDPS
jgi:hypothetical protein